MAQAQTRALVDTLKQALKQAGMTYGDVARGLGMSEANIKRMFSTCSLSLDRLESICRLIDFQVTDLVLMMQAAEQRISSLTQAQEQALVDDRRLLLVALCARNHWTFEDITGNYRIEDTECIRLLAQLDKLRLIDLMPGNRIRLLVAEDFRWLPGGPIERFFEREIQAEFLASNFARADEYRQYLGGTITAASAALLKRRLQALAREFAELHRADASLPASERVNIGMVLALRPWESSAFSEIRRTGRARTRATHGGAQ